MRFHDRFISATRRGGGNSVTSSGSVRITIDTDEVTKTLSRLSPMLNEAVRKKAIRKGFKPFVPNLKAVLLNAPYIRSGKKVHRKAIASATRVSSPKRMGPAGAPIRAELGVIMGRKGGARAKGRQFVYPWTEGGFVHHNSGRFVAGNHYGQLWGRANISRITQAISSEILIEARKILGMGNTSVPK
tara:strand:+ start:2122 stop:2682 length:561 start_codon:yes stop_codon:yes gene_type:complete